MSNERTRNWIDDVEIENADILWAWSNFDGNDSMSGPGNYNFTVKLPQDLAEQMERAGWTSIKKSPGYEEGDPDEFTIKVTASWKVRAPMIFFIKGNRKIRVEEKDFGDIRRDNTKQIDVIMSPYSWSLPNGDSGVKAYVKEMYVVVNESRFSRNYADYEDA